MRSPSKRSSPRLHGAPNDRRASLAGNLVYLLLALAVVSVVVGVAFVVSSTSVSIAADGGQGNQPATSAAPSGMLSGDTWIPLRSQAPADILAAARRSALFQESRPASGEGALDLSRLGRPVFVQALRPVGVTTAQAPDFYVVPILDPADVTTSAAELVLSPSHTAVQVIAIVTYAAPRANDSIACLPQDQAVRAVVSQHPEAAQGIGQPYLVYFLPDPRLQASQSSQDIWTAGGMLPADPIWLIPTVDGGQYFAGDDGKVYIESQLPLWDGRQ